MITSLNRRLRDVCVRDLRERGERDRDSSEMGKLL